MFTPVSMRSANTYRTIDIESSVLGSNPHQLVGLMFSTLLQSLAKARTAIQNRDTTAKVRAIAHSLRLLEEGLKGALDTNRGGAVAATLASLYDYCVLRTTEANLRNDAGMIDEVIALIKPVAEGWDAIKGAPEVRAFQG
jgi:flagellar secretion chaperone FliS